LPLPWRCRSIPAVELSDAEEMLTMTNPETAKTLSMTVKSVDSSATLFAKVTPRFKKFSAALKEAIEKESLAKVELYLPELEEVAEEIDNAMHGTKGSLALIGHLRRDKEFLEQKFDTVEKLTVKVANIETCLIDYRKQTSELIKKGSTAIGKLETGNNELLGDLASLKDQYNDMVKAIDYFEKEGGKLEAEARKAHAANNEKVMLEARRKFMDVGYRDYTGAPVKLQIDLKKFLAKATDKAQRQEAVNMQSDVPSLESRLRALSNTGGELSLLRVVKAEKEEAPIKLVTYTGDEIKKSAAAAGLTDIKELTRIMNKVPRYKWLPELDKLGKTCKPPMSGKQILEKIEKQSFMKKRDLIDI
jgi:chromosome segregation ATPase